VPVSWWVVTAGLVGLFGAEIHIGLPLGWKIGTYVVLGLVAAALLLFFGSARVRVTSGELWAGRARLPLRVVGRVDVLGREELRRALGRDADPTAYRLVPPWLRRGVRIQVDDPAEKTPYWLVGSRRPEELAAAVQEARQRA
jgi:hypothetical protein